jgi:CBS domain containing-hemolysin-like protein
MTAADVILVAVLTGLLVALFVLALAEASMLRVRPSQVAVVAEAGDARARLLLRLLDRLPRVMNAVLFAVLLAQVAGATIAGVLASRWMGGTGTTISTAVVTLVVFVYGEAIPKTLAVRRPLDVAIRLARPLQALTWVTRPFVGVLVRLADLQLPGSGVTTMAALSEEELRLLVDEAAKAGRIEPSDAELIERSFTFGDTTMVDVLVPLADVVAVPVDERVDVALQLAIGAGHRRLPVFDGSAENLTGFVRMRDLAEAMTEDGSLRVGDRRRELLRVRGTELITTVLRAMQASDRHLASVVDEDGNSVGIVTVEDIVEELVGSIDEQER